MSEEAETPGKQFARIVGAAFGGEHKFQRCFDEDESLSINLLRASDGEFTRYSTIGLRDHENRIGDRDIRVELLGVAATDKNDFVNVLGTCAFNVMKDGWRCAPGIVHPDVLEMYDLSDTMSHVMFVEPFEWEELSTVVIDDLQIHCLLAVPISESERRYLVEHGFEAFEDLLAEAEAPYYDLDRAPLC